MHEEILRVACESLLVMADWDYPKEYLAEKKKCCIHSIGRVRKRNSG